jgi:hypothetical protein
MQKGRSPRGERPFLPQLPMFYGLPGVCGTPAAGKRVSPNLPQRDALRVALQEQLMVRLEDGGLVDPAVVRSRVGELAAAERRIDDVVLVGVDDVAVAVVDALVGQVGDADQRDAGRRRAAENLLDIEAGLERAIAVLHAAAVDEHRRDAGRRLAGDRRELLVREGLVDVVREDEVGHQHRHADVAAVNRN